MTPDRDYNRRMRALLLIVAGFAVVMTEARPAHAIAACYSNTGIAPHSGATVPPRARLIVFADSDRGDTWQYQATIDGKPVKLKRTSRKSAPFSFTELEVDSAATGTLAIYRGTRATGEPLARYTVTARVALPTSIDGATSRYTQNFPHSTVKELYDALAIDLGDAPAILAHVKVRRDAKAAWSELEVPVYARHVLAPTKVRVLLGELGCTRNYTVKLLEAGVELEVSALLPDGKLVPIKLPSRVTLPAAKTP